MQPALQPREVAVYYHRGLEALVMHEVRRPFGRLGDQVGIAMAAVIGSPRFVVDREAWRRWKHPGDPCHGKADPDCRRFADVRGLWTPGERAPSDLGRDAVPILYDPHAQPYFHTPDLRPVSAASRILIKGRTMLAIGVRP